MAENIHVHSVAHSDIGEVYTVMKFAMASYGTRGDIEPAVAVGRELQRRGHEVRMAVPPDLIGFAGSVGLSAVPYGIHVGPQLDEYRDLWTSWTRHFWRLQDLVALCRQALKLVTEQWSEMSETLVSVAEGADLLSTSVGYEEPAANVAEFYGIPLVALHTMPWRPNGQLFPALPPMLTRTGMTAYDWLTWRVTKGAEDAQRRYLGLPQATSPSPQRIGQRNSLEIQAYDAVCFRGLAEEWAKYGGRRPFVGALTMELTTSADDEVMSWIAAGPPPICFASGSIPVESPAETVEMISSACAELGERALVCAGATDFSGVQTSPHVKLVGVVNYAAVFPVSRAIVHHGGSGTTAASLRAGVPTLILWTVGDQPFWGNQLRRMGVGASRRFSTTTRDSLVSDLRTILTPECAARARAIAPHMSKPHDSVSKAADLLEAKASHP
ncbi:Putative glycosyltransferase GtfA [Mycobacteroides abscessus subsp. massiliense]|uniref:Glycosyltransferase GtfA n=2 Tax=Mycobacteroides abscessus TaxID=36809 RepID=A0A9Q7SFD9_9MYCO|nr:putative glycosyltransferase GtfA [Mycobacteroides abscessus subsp. bolletii BD]ORA30614.1 glycosyl transferase family 1 [Mycobacteroides abscessus subsp. bolletii]PVA37510.1 glycosyltransferase [Mycobacteroides abscessus]SLF23178.1 Putative glycosyltransferase GtfA [Mycobacteroides abscessus subsp. massiliense]RIU23388.1 glycosyltransferase [Mycobacteroides abscessus]